MLDRVVASRMKARAPYIRIDTRKDFAEISRGWPIEGHGTRNEVLTLCWLGIVPLVATLVKMFPAHKKTIADFFRTTADAIEEGSVLPGTKGTD